MLKKYIPAMVLGIFLLSAAVAQAHTDISDDYQKGLTSYNLGDYSKALQYFKNVVDQDSDSWLAFQKEGYCYFHLGQEEKMKLAFFESLRLHPRNPELKAFIAGLPPGEKESSPASESSPSSQSLSSFVSSEAGGFSIGGQLYNWGANYNSSQIQTEFDLPVSLCVNPAKGFSLYLQTELGVGTNYYYNYPTINSSTLGVLSDTTLGTKLSFELGTLKPFVSFGVEIPTGDLRFKYIQTTLPSQFVDVRYQGVTFGISALAGVEIPEGNGGFTLEAGYMDPGVFNQTFDLPQGNINNSLGSDAFFFSAKRKQTFENIQNQEYGLCFLAYDPELAGGTPIFQLGPSFDFFYRFDNPQGFSLDSGAQFFLRSQTSPLIFHFAGLYYFYYTYGPMAPEPHNSRGPRLYLNPSIALHDVTFGFQVNHVFPNDYPGDGGGWLLGFGPTWRIRAGEKAAVKILANYQKIIDQNNAVAMNGQLVDLLFDVFQVGIKYEIGF